MVVGIDVQAVVLLVEKLACPEIVLHWFVFLLENYVLDFLQLLLVLHLLVLQDL